MPFHPFVIDDSIESSGGRSAYVLQGYYLMEVVSGVLTPPDYEKEMNVRWACRIVEGPDGVGRTIYRYTTWENSKQWGFGQLFAVCGIQLGPLKNVPINTYQDLKTLVDTKLVPAITANPGPKQFVALVGDSDYSTTKTSEIKDMFPASDWTALQTNNARMIAAALTPPAPVAFPQFAFPGAAVPNGVPPQVPQMPAAPAVVGQLPVPPTVAPPAAAPEVSPDLVGKVQDMFAGVQL